MFDTMTQEQRDAWLRKVRNVDASLKSAVQTPADMKPQRRLHLVPALPHMRRPVAA